MSIKRKNEGLDQVAEKAKELVDRGNQRHIVIRNSENKQIADLTFTSAAIIGLILLFFQPFGTFALVVGTIYAIATKMRVEVVRDVTSKDDEIELPQD